MTRAKDTIPRPSHPINKQIRLGIKIRKFMDKTKRSTIWMKRRMNGSPNIYEEENIKTLAEINRTTDLNKHP